MLEACMAEWGIEPVAIMERWSLDLFLLMARQLMARRKAEAEAMEEASKKSNRTRGEALLEIGGRP